jgi:hypothetical protein
MLRRKIRVILRCFCAIATLTWLAGCSTTLVKDPKRPVTAAAHCEGSQWVNDSSVAVVPLPVVAFLSPRADVNTIKADDYLNGCGDHTRLVNREVTLDTTACIPASLSYIVSLGIYQWCPAHATWQADVAQVPPVGTIIEHD